ncbi:MAG: Ig-like domain-containing protein [Thermoplasmata archaeon]
MKKAIISLLGVWVLVCANFITTGISSAAYIVSSDPDNGTTDVSVEAWIVIRFNTTMNKESVAENLEIRPELDPYGYRLDWDNDGTELTIKPNADLRYSRNYTILIEEAEDVDGNPLDGPTSIYFETESEQEIDVGTSLESSKNLILIISFLVFGLIFGILMGFYLARRRVKSK